MNTLKGITVSSGIAVGQVCLYLEKDAADVPHYVIDPQRVDREIERLRNARSAAVKDIESLSFRAQPELKKQAADIFNAHKRILEDTSLFARIVQLIRDKLINAEHAVLDVFKEYGDRFSRGEGHFAELAHDIQDIRNRMLTAFSGQTGTFKCRVGENRPVIVAAQKLTPSMLLSLKKERVLAFVTAEGGFTTHATILARGFGVPIIFGVDVAGSMNCGDACIVDGSLSKVILNPDKKTTAYYARKVEQLNTRRNYCALRKTEKAKSKTGIKITLKANISTPHELNLLNDIAYDGIGLLRTEFLFNAKNAPPTEDEQFSLYRMIIEQIRQLPASVRLLDIGQDKLPGYITLPHQDNPELGIRGARAIGFFRDLYMAQIRALLRASAYGDIRILYPMVSDAHDLMSFKGLVRDAKQQLRKEGKAFNKKIREGVMFETPSSGLLARHILPHVDFANIGSNDLLQYTLAASRGNPAVERRYHILHPALLMLLEMIAGAGAALKKEICLCGEIAGFEEFYPLMLSAGVRSFSVSAAKLSDIKCSLLYTRMSGEGKLNRFYASHSAEEIDEQVFRGK